VNNQKGITLIEVLAAITILMMVILSVSYLFTKSYEHSYKEEKLDVSVNIARTVIEELKKHLKDTQTTTIQISTSNENQPLTLDISALRNAVTQTTDAANLFYPSSRTKRYKFRTLPKRAFILSSAIIFL
jgi:type II secretory pathway pseudopilin PulG